MSLNDLVKGGGTVINIEGTPITREDLELLIKYNIPFKYGAFISNHTPTRRDEGVES